MWADLANHALPGSYRELSGDRTRDIQGKSEIINSTPLLAGTGAVSVVPT